MGLGKMLRTGLLAPLKTTKALLNAARHPIATLKAPGHLSKDIFEAHVGKPGKKPGEASGPAGGRVIINGSSS